MKISVDTKEDSHEEIRKVIKMLQSLVGDAQESFTNQPASEPSTETAGSPFANIFGDTSAPAEAPCAAPETYEETNQKTREETSQSTEDLFAELFSEEELKKMDIKKEDEEAEIKPNDKKYGIELY